MKSKKSVPAAVLALEKSLYMALLCVLATFFLAMPARADSVQIATLDIVTTGCPICYQTVSLSNLTSVTLTGTGFDENGSGPYPGGFPVSVGPGATLANFFGCEGSCYLNTYTVLGTLSGLDFSIGGQNYQATSLDWTAPTYIGSFNGTLSIDINATPVPAPEPGTNILMLLGIGFALVLRKLTA